jgi:putative nucleotidyltransferase with HDIG domain
MFSFFTRQRLIRRGLASAKWRRRLRQSEWIDSLRCGWFSRWIVVVALALVLGSLVSGECSQPEAVQRLVLEFLVYALAVALVWMNHRSIWNDNGRLLLLLGTLVGHVWLVRCSVAWAQEATVPAIEGWTAVDRQQLWSLAVPYALGPMLLSVLLGQRLGIVIAIFGSFFGAMLKGGVDARLLVTSLLCGYVGALTTREVRRRKDLLWAGILVGASALVLGVIPGRAGAFSEGQAGWWNWNALGWDCVAAFGGGLAVVFLIFGILPVLEGVFRITTPITWMELADLNHPLLKRMTIEAPGSYHHSLMVAQLAEAAAESIGANAAMVRVCAYFHDVGKLVKPEYFVENARHGRKAHEDLAPTMSALIIIAHVKEGVDLAIKHRLNREIIDVIQQHHGCSMVYYFYRKAVEQQTAWRAAALEAGHEDEEPPEVREESFRYHGPRPKTKESAIISLADTVESASRSLEKVTPHKIDQLVEELIQKRLAEGELKECDLQLSELTEVGESFKRTLRSILHTRIAYPKPVGSSTRSAREERMMGRH